MVTPNALSLDQAQRTLELLRRPDLAQMIASGAGFANGLRVITIALDTAQLAGAPLKLSFPFTSVTVVSTSDPSAKVNMRFDTDASYNDPITVQLPATIEFPLPVTGAFIDWAAQSGKTITLAFLNFGVFRTNIINLALSGGVTLQDGTSLATLTIPLVTGANSPLIAADPLRKFAEFSNETAGDMWLGGSAIGASGQGRRLPIGASYELRNTGALYAWVDDPSPPANLYGLKHT